jgi:hypothetical protein
MTTKHGKWWECYQLAGILLLAPGHLTEGQRERLTELLLDVLSEPDRYDAKAIRLLRNMAMKP